MEDHAKTMQDAIAQAQNLLADKEVTAVVMIPATMEGAWDEGVVIIRVAELAEPNWYTLTPGRDLDESALEEALIEIDIAKQERDGVALFNRPHPSATDRRKH